MTTYLIARMQITDPERYSDYGTKAPALFAKHGGRYIGSGDPKTLEGPSRRLMRFLLACVAFSLGAMAWLPGIAAAAEEASEEASVYGSGNADRVHGFVIPFTDPRRGRELFVGKGCVICHSVNGVGGEVASPLDADPSQRFTDAFEFAARMWRGAATMIVLQEMGLGYQIELTGEELAHIARFISDPEAQKRFSEDDIPDLIMDWMVEDTYKALDLLLEELDHIAE